MLTTKSEVGIFLCFIAMIKKCFLLLECSWNHKYFGPLAKVTWSPYDVHGIMNTLVLLQSKGSPKGFVLTLHGTRSFHDSMNIPQIEIITYINILL